MRQYLYTALEARPETTWQRAVQGGIQLLIVLNVTAAVLESVPALRQRFGRPFLTFEIASVIAFTVEYLARLYACTIDPRYAHPIFGRLRFARSFFPMCDLIAILPAYLLAFGTLDLRVVRALRLLRVARVLKLGRYSRAMRRLGEALTRSVPEMFIVLFGMTIVLVVASALLHLAERDVQPGVFGSIPAAAWWGVATLTTVGYGDVTPITPMGKLAAAVVAVVGVGFFALPAGILGATFLEVARDDVGLTTCPSCGATLQQDRAARGVSPNAVRTALADPDKRARGES